MPPQPVSIFDRIRSKIQAPCIECLPFDRQFSDYLFDPGVCWIWTGAYSDKGTRGAPRPVIQLAGRGSPVRHVARVMLCLRDGTPLFDPIDFQAAHECDNPPCVNPWHLEWRTGPVNRREQRERVSDVIARLREIGMGA